MIPDIEDLKHLDLDTFSSELDSIKEEIMSGDAAVEGEDAIVLEIIRVIQEEIESRKAKFKKGDLQKDVKFLAYVNLFNSILSSSFDDDEDMDEDEDDDYESFAEDEEE